MSTLYLTYCHIFISFFLLTAKNAFERSLADAKGLKDVNVLLGPDFSDAVRQEAHDLVFGEDQSPEAVQRLFSLFVQREDMREFSHDFKEFEDALGSANDEDLLNWSRFSLVKPDDIEDVDAFVKERAEEESGVASKKQEVNAEEKEQALSLEDPLNFVDPDGRPWYGILVDTDSTQKPMALNRLMSDRCLIVIGNLKGSAGFGMGKGPSPDEALKRAFRYVTDSLPYMHTKYLFITVLAYLEMR